MGNGKIQILRAYLPAHLAEQLQLGGEAPAEPQGVKQQTKHQRYTKCRQPQVFSGGQHAAQHRVDKLCPVMPAKDYGASIRVGVPRNI
ncbi:hypothetical protein D3C87_1968710 [compost metagenome]